MTTDADLRALAEAAPRGRWYALIDDYGGDGRAGSLFLTAEAELRGRPTPLAQAMPDNVGRYIAAASPDRILALLDRLAAAEARSTALEAEAVQLDELLEAAITDYNDEKARSTALEGALRDVVASLYQRRHDLAFPPETTDWQAFAREALALTAARALLAPDEEAPHE